MAAVKSLVTTILGVLISSVALAQTPDAINFREMLYPVKGNVFAPPGGFFQKYNPGKVATGPLTVGGSTIFSLRSMCLNFAKSNLKQEVSEATNADEIKIAAYLALKNIFSVHKHLDDRWMLNPLEKNLISDIRSEIKQWTTDFADTAEQFCEAEDLNISDRLTEEQAQYTRDALEFIREVLGTTSFRFN